MMSKPRRPPWVREMISMRAGLSSQRPLLADDPEEFDWTGSAVGAKHERVVQRLHKFRRVVREGLTQAGSGLEVVGESAQGVETQFAAAGIENPQGDGDRRVQDGAVEILLGQSPDRLSALGTRDASGQVIHRDMDAAPQP